MSEIGGQSQEYQCLKLVDNPMCINGLNWWTIKGVSMSEIGGQSQVYQCLKLVDNQRSITV